MSLLMLRVEDARGGSRFLLLSCFLIAVRGWMDGWMEYSSFAEACVCVCVWGGMGGLRRGELIDD